MKPHRTIVLLGKQFNRNDGDKYDRDVVLQQRVIQNYHELADDKSYGVIVVANLGTKQEVNLRIKEALLP
jgi:thymidylate kinase